MRAWTEGEKQARVLLAFPGVRMGCALSQMEAQAFLLVQIGWALLRTEELHTRRHAHSLQQTSHQVLPTYLIARPQHRDHCESGGACP